jgi:hypothetical protein
MAGKQPGYVLPAMSLYAKWTGTADETAIVLRLRRTCLRDHAQLQIKVWWTRSRCSSSSNCTLSY